jgi:hypothetical protein
MSNIGAREIKKIVSENREAFEAYCTERKVDASSVESVQAAREAFALSLKGETPKGEKRDYEARTVDLLALGTDAEGRRLVFRTASGVPYRVRDIHADALRLAAGAAGLTAVSVKIAEDCE